MHKFVPWVSIPFTYLIPPLFMGEQVLTFVILWGEIEWIYSLVTQPLSRGVNTNNGTFIHTYGLADNVSLFKQSQLVSFVVFWGVALNEMYYLVTLPLYKR